MVISRRLQQVLNQLQVTADTNAKVAIIVKFLSLPLDYVSVLERSGASRVERLADTTFVSCVVSARSIPKIDSIPGVIEVHYGEAVYAKMFDIAPAGLDVQYIVTLPESINFMGADVAYAKGMTGSGVKIAVIDSGVNNDHPMLRGKVSQNIQIASGDINDGLGHGTHVASIAAGKWAKSPLGDTQGIAPEAEIINVKALKDDGSGSLADIVKAVEKAVLARADIINLSLGRNYDCGGTCPLCQYIKSVKDKAFFVVAAGNAGPDSGSIGCPSVTENVISVGSSTIKPIKDGVSYFSSRGPTDAGMVKPDICGTGGGSTKSDIPEYIYAAISGKLDGFVDGIKDHYEPLRGTSMATPHISGFLALLLSGTGKDIKIDDLWKATAINLDSPDKDAMSGWGRAFIPSALQYRPIKGGKN